MVKKYKFSTARSELTSLIDQVQSNRPQFIEHRKKSEDDVFLIKRKQFYDAFKKIGQFVARIKTLKEDDNSVTIIFDPLGLAVNNKDFDSAFSDLYEECVSYANEYMNNFELYSRAPNRKDHLPLVFLILNCLDQNELKGLLNIA